jgi:DNA-binding PadR family transcriptional regulator
MRHRHRHHHGFGRHGLGFLGFGRRFFGPGEVRIALLSLLEDGPRHGYELMKELEARSGGTYRASAGTVYPTLQQLEDEDLIASDEASGKRVYRLRDEGRRELEREAATVRRIWRRADDWCGFRDAAAPEASEILRPAGELLKTALRTAADSDDPDVAARIREILERAAGEIEGLAGSR